MRFQSRLSNRSHWGGQGKFELFKDIQTLTDKIKMKNTLSNIYFVQTVQANGRKVHISKRCTIVLRSSLFSWKPTSRSESMV